MDHALVRRAPAGGGAVDRGPRARRGGPPMRANRIRDLVRDGRVAYGVGLGINSPDLVELCGELGFDFVFLDGEHGATTATICRELQRAADVVGIETIVRVPHNDPPSIVPYL